MAQLDLLASIVVFSIILYIRRRANRSIRGLPLPPGPKKLPLIGNMFDIPKSSSWITYHDMCKSFDSDIIHLDIAGTSIVVLDTADAAIELLEKRSSLYSGRPSTVMVTELMGWDFALGMMPYGDRWRRHRKLMHQAFHPAAAVQFQPQERKATLGLLLRLLDEPDGLMSHLRLMTGETIMSITYGLDVLPKDDPYLTTIERGIASLVSAAAPGAFLVNAIPVLKYVPEWMPFADFKRKAKEGRRLSKAVVDHPFSATKRNIANGDLTPSFCLNHLEKMDRSGDLVEQESVIKGTAGQMYLAGADTTLSAIATCVLGLLSNPEALRKAQKEVDSVVGFGQIPDFCDESSMPYITAIVREAMRWKDVTPLGGPHYVLVDDEYKGYRIPAGSIVIANSWAMLHDEAIYPRPFEFNPDRFMKDGKLNPDIKDPGHATFGFGRRICPGRHMALSAIWIAVASLIATFDITKAIDENGKVIEPSYEFLSEFVCTPLPFKCSIKPRSKEIEQSIRSFANDSQ